jgi:hypothetical protein
MEVAADVVDKQEVSHGPRPGTIRYLLHSGELWSYENLHRGYPDHKRRPTRQFQGDSAIVDNMSEGVIGVFRQISAYKKMSVRYREVHALTEDSDLPPLYRRGKPK